MPAETQVPGWEASPFAIGFLNPNGHIVHCNEALRVLVGYTADELAGMPVASFTHPDDSSEDRLELPKAARAGRSTRTGSTCG